jgi:ATP-dependent Lhr-like helicase
VPAAYLEPVDDPLGDVVSRYARTHAPFTPAEAAESLGLPPAVITDTLERLERRGRVTRGAFRPVGADREWVDVDVLRRLRRRSLAAARSEVEAADPAAFSLFLTRWHGLASPGRGATRLVEVIRRLQGVALPASILEADVLPARLDYSADMLDALTASGEVVWIGRGPLGARDGRVGLYLRDQVPLLAWPLDLEIPAGEPHEVIRNNLAERGASFFRDLYDAAGGGDPDTVLDAIWDLVWAGLVTNDTLAPLRARLWGRARRVGRRGPRLPSASAPPSGSGRWYLVADLSARSSLDTEKAMARGSPRSWPPWKRPAGSAVVISSTVWVDPNSPFPEPSTASGPNPRPAAPWWWRPPIRPIPTARRSRGPRPTRAAPPVLRERTPS